MNENQDNPKQSSKAKTIVGLALLVGFLAISYFIYNDIMVSGRNEKTFLYFEKEATESQKSPAEKQRDSIILIARQAVIKDNGRRLDVDFPPNLLPKITNEKPNRWMVTGIVDLKDNNGTPVRTKYYLTLKANPLCDDYYQMACWTILDTQYQQE